jgi:Xaa-Pro aminopeptidase
MTRTIVVGEASEKMLDIYNTVKEAQAQALNCIKEGVKASEVDKIARDYIKSKGYGDYFGHGLGHGVGLEIHEAPAVNSRNHIVLKEGMIITDEPGIYIPDFGGVRIEDLILVKKDGCEVLSKSSKELICI